MAAIKRIVSGIIGTSLRAIVIAVVVMFVYRWSIQAYEFGFRIFAEEPVSIGSGRDVEITVPMGDGAMDIGKILEQHGLIKDAKLFYCQELLSAYHGKLQAGSYTLNTAMSATEMMAIMADSDDSEGDDSSDS